VALREEVALDISAALRQVDALERRLTSAAQGFQRVLTDALSGVSGVSIEVDVDTAGVTAAIDGAVDAADVTVPVTADTAQVEQQLASLDVADVAVNVDTTDAVDGLERATDATEEYQRQTRETEQDVGRFIERLRLLAAIAATAFAVQLVRVGVEYNTLVQQASAAFETILGSADEAQALLASIAEFASTSPFPRQAFIEATQQLLAFGFAADEVIPTLDAIQQAIAAAGGTTVDLQEVVRIFAQIRSTGRLTAEDLNQLGIRGINAAELIGQAFGQTAGEIRDSITAGTLDADEALAALTEQIGTRFEGATDRVRDTFLGTIDRIRAALRDLSALLTSGFVDPTGGGAAIEIGNQLADELRGLETAIGPLVEQFNTEFLPVLVELAGDVLPALFDVIEAGLPIFGGLGQATTVLLRVLQAATAVIAAIPPEFLAIAATAFSFYRATQLVSAGLALLRTRAQQASLALSATNPLMFAFVAAATAISFVLGQGSGAVSEFDQDVASLTRTLQGAEPTLEVFRQSIEDALLGEDGGQGLSNLLNRLGLTTDELIQAARAGEDFRAAIDDAFGDDLPSFALDALNDRLNEQIDLITAAAEAQLDYGVATGLWTQEQVIAARASASLAGSSLIAVDALTELRDAQIEQAAASERAADAARVIGEALALQVSTVSQLAAEYPALADAVAAVSNEAVPAERDLLNLAIAADEAGIAGEDLEAVAASLGISVDALRAFIAGATGALDDFTSAATSRLPTSGSIFRDLSTVATSARSVPETMRRATQQTERFVEALQDARAALEEALRPATEVDLEQAEINIAGAQEKQVEAVERVAAAEDALRRVRFDAANEGIDAAELRARRERELREAQLAVRQAQVDEIEARQELLELQQQGTDADEDVIEARERVAEATRDLARAQTEAADETEQAERRTRGAADRQVVTAARFTQALIDEANRLRTFREALQTITDAGFAEVAATIAREGPEIGGALASELAAALNAGNRQIVEDLDDALTLFEQEWSLTTEFFRDQLGPEFILQAGIIGSGAADAFGSNLDFAERVRIAAELAESGLDLQGQAIATVAAQAGEDAARDYARLLDLEGPTVEAAIAAGLALRRRTPSEDARIAGEALGVAYSDGIAEGMAKQSRKLEETARLLALGVIEASKKALKIASPSQAAAEQIGAPFVEGIIAGLSAGESDVTAAVGDLTSAMLALTGGGNIAATVRTPAGAATAAGITAGPAGGASGGAPLVGELRIYTSDAATGMRTALTDLAAIQRRTR